MGETERERERERERVQLWCWLCVDLASRWPVLAEQISLDSCFWRERGANLKLSGDPQLRDRKARAGTLCQKPTEQSSDPYLEDSSVKIHRADKGVYIQLRFLSWHSFTVRHAVRAESGFLSQTNSVSLRERERLLILVAWQTVHEPKLHALAQKGTAWAYLSVYPPNKHPGSPGDPLCVVMAVLQTQ